MTTETTVSVTETPSARLTVSFTRQVFETFYEQVEREGWPDEQRQKVRAEILKGIEMEMKGE